MEKILTAKNDRAVSGALEILTPHMRSLVTKTIAKHSLDPYIITDIRIRTGGRSYLIADGGSYELDGDVSRRMMDELIFTLSERSVYAHADTIKEGFIDCGGIRCGVAGRAVTSGERVTCVTECTSVSIRIIHDMPGCAEELYGRITGDMRGALVYSPPGGGKTTLLRDLIRLLSRDRVQFAVVDTRGELAGAAAGGSGDILLHHPKPHGIISAVRSLCPEVIICDELSGDEDADAMIYSVSCGVPVIATCHAPSREQLMLRPDMRRLCDSGTVSFTAGLRRRPGGFEFDITAG